MTAFRFVAKHLRQKALPSAVRPHSQGPSSRRARRISPARERSARRQSSQRLRAVPNSFTPHPWHMPVEVSAVRQEGHQCERVAQGTVVEQPRHERRSRVDAPIATTVRGDRRQSAAAGQVATNPIRPRSTTDQSPALPRPTSVRPGSGVASPTRSTHQLLLRRPDGQITRHEQYQTTGRPVAKADPP